MRFILITFCCFFTATSYATKLTNIKPFELFITSSPHDHDNLNLKTSHVEIKFNFGQRNQAYNKFLMEEFKKYEKKIRLLGSKQKIHESKVLFIKKMFSEKFFGPKEQRYLNFVFSKKVSHQKVLDSKAIYLAQEIIQDNGFKFKGEFKDIHTKKVKSIKDHIISISRLDSKDLISIDISKISRLQVLAKEYAQLAGERQLIQSVSEIENEIADLDLQKKIGPLKEKIAQTQKTIITTATEMRKYTSRIQEVTKDDPAHWSLEDSHRRLRAVSNKVNNDKRHYDNKGMGNLKRIEHNDKKKAKRKYYDKLINEALNAKDIARKNDLEEQFNEEINELEENFKNDYYDDFYHKRFVKYNFYDFFVLKDILNSSKKDLKKSKDELKKLESDINTIDNWDDYISQLKNELLTKRESKVKEINTKEEKILEEFSQITIEDIFETN